MTFIVGHNLTVGRLRPRHSPDHDPISTVLRGKQPYDRRISCLGLAYYILYHKTLMCDCFRFAHRE